MKFVGLVLLIVVAALFLGEAALVVGYFVLPFAAWRWSSRSWVSGLVTAACLVALILHVSGFKLYGRAIVVANQESLTKPRRVVALEPPAKVLFQDGGTIQLPDVFFPKSIDLLQGTTNYHEVFQDAYGVHTELRHDQYHQEWIDVEVENATAKMSKAICLRHALYGCGGTWFPQFFPRRLPRQVREDFGVVLVRAGVALPTIDHLAKAPVYRDSLMQALRRSSFLNLPRQNPEVIRLGHFLVENRPEDFEIGAELLIQTDDTPSYPQLAIEVRKRRENKPLAIEELISPGMGVPPFGLLLIRLDRTVAEKLMKDFETQVQPDILWATEIAGIISRNGNFSGFDFLVSVLAKPGLSGDYRDSLGTQLTLRFGFLRGGAFLNQ